MRDIILFMRDIILLAAALLAVGVALTYAAILLGQENCEVIDSPIEQRRCGVGPDEPELSPTNPSPDGGGSSDTQRVQVDASPPGSSEPVAGCLEAPRDLGAEVNKPLIIEVRIWAGSCNDEAAAQQAQTRIGTQVQAQLLAPSLPMNISALGAEMQPIAANRGGGNFSWTVKADKPGDYDLTLSVAVLDNSNDLVFQNRRENINLLVRSTFGYEVGNIWSVFIGLVPSLEGAVVGIATILTTLAVFKWRRRSVSSSADQRHPQFPRLRRHGKVMSASKSRRVAGRR